MDEKARQRAEEILADIQARGRMAIGKLPYEKFLRGENISAVASIRANCYSCMGYYADGKVDCKNETCAFYRWMPYGRFRRPASVPEEELPPEVLEEVEENLDQEEAEPETEDLAQEEYPEAAAPFLAAAGETQQN
jgi:hypothetical protein